MFAPMLFLVVCLLIIFFALDTYLYRKEGQLEVDHSEKEKIGLDGSFNLLLLAGVVGGVYYLAFGNLK